jgi:hypothetical protein
MTGRQTHPDVGNSAPVFCGIDEMVVWIREALTDSPLGVGGKQIILDVSP